MAQRFFLNVGVKQAIKHIALPYLSKELRLLARDHEKVKSKDTLKKLENEVKVN